MIRLVRFAAVRLVLLAMAVGALVQADTHGQAARPRRIAVFGSSVANGTGDEFGKEGYTGLLRQMFASRGWEVLNQSRGGDTTRTMAPRFAPEGTPDPRTRYLVPVNPGYVVIGLSLANEGIWEAKTKADKDAIFQQYADGIRGFVTMSRQNNIMPIVALVYPRMVYGPVEYEYVRRVNLLQNSWDVPTVNFLGALDDGTGHFTIGFDFDDKHPNAAGHRELLYAFVPTLFEALEKGKPIPASPAEPRGFARIAGGVSPLSFAPSDTMHSFALSVMVRTQSDGTVAAVSGTAVTGRIELKRLERQGAGATDFHSMTLTEDGPFAAGVAVQNGKWTYKASNGIIVASNISADRRWHHLVLSHHTARGETQFFVDGNLVGKVAERLQPSLFVLGGSGGASSRQADYKDAFLFRAGLNGDEVAALHDGRLLQASLEIYSPLNDADFRTDSVVENRAQSLSGFKVGPGRITHLEPGATETR